MSGVKGWQCVMFLDKGGDSFSGPLPGKENLNSEAGCGGAHL